MTFCDLASIQFSIDACLVEYVHTRTYPHGSSPYKLIYICVFNPYGYLSIFAVLSAFYVKLHMYSDF